MSYGGYGSYGEYGGYGSYGDYVVTHCCCSRVIVSSVSFAAVSSETAGYSSGHLACDVGRVIVSFLTSGMATHSRGGRFPSIGVAGETCV